jgi:hypothetical protein
VRKLRKNVQIMQTYAIYIKNAQKKKRGVEKRNLGVKK